MSRKRHEPLAVRITMEGGVIEHVKVPPGVRVEIWDFDIEGIDPKDLDTSDRGEKYYKSVYEPPPTETR